MTNLPLTKDPFTFVLSGGGARGALQVGAMYALLDAGYQPEMLVGVSIGAVNAAFLAVHGFSRQSLDFLKKAWLESIGANLLPSNYIWLALRAMVGRSSDDPARKIREFLIANGLTPELRFADLQQTKLVIVSADLYEAKPVLHGLSGEEKVLDSLLISTSLPPWFMPVKDQDKYLMDAGVVSNLPVESAVRAGAKQIIAMDLLDARGVQGFGVRLPEFFEQLSVAGEKRQTALEMQLAEIRGVPTRFIGLFGDSRVPFWDFSKSPELIEQGYQITWDYLVEQDMIR